MEPWDGPAASRSPTARMIGARARPQRPAPRPLLGHRGRPGGARVARPACSTSTRPPSCARAGCSRAGCSWSTPTAAGSSRTTRSRPSWPRRRPYDEWLHAGLIHLDDLPEREHVVHTHASVTRRQQTFGYTEEELRVLLAPMARAGAEPIGSMGTDTPIAVLSEPAAAALRLLHPALRPGDQPAAGRDPGGAGHRLCAAPSGPRTTCWPRPRAHAGRSCCHSRSSTTTSWRRSSTSTATATCPGFATHVVRGLFRVAGGGAELAERLDEICHEVSEAIADGARILVLSDRNSDATWRRSRRCCSPPRCITT